MSSIKTKNDFIMWKFPSHGWTATYYISSSVVWLLGHWNIPSTMEFCKRKWISKGGQFSCGPPKCFDEVALSSISVPYKMKEGTSEQHVMLAHFLHGQRQNVGHLPTEILYAQMLPCSWGEVGCIYIYIFFDFSRVSRTNRKYKTLLKCSQET